MSEQRQDRALPLSEHDDDYDDVMYMFNNNMNDLLTTKNYIVLIK